MMVPSKAGPPSVAPIRWLFLGFAFAGTVLNYLDRQTLSIAAPVLRRELHFGDIEYSRIVAAFAALLCLSVLFPITFLAAAARGVRKTIDAGTVPH